MRVFVTGGAGYIGSHMVKLLGEKGFEVLTYDNLSNGRKEAVLYGHLVVGDLLDYELLEKTLRDFMPDVVMHFAAKVSVEESVKEPILYYENNFCGTLNLLKAVKKLGIGYFILSSTAAVYGIAQKVPVKEEDPTVPINPYGWSKLFCERALIDLRASGYPIKYAILRYFNVAGADPEGKIGQVSKNPTHLILRALKAAKGEIPYLEVYGTDYPTKDGTAIRDYIHVMDLVQAHLDVLEYLMKGGQSDVFNVGYGRGYSVLEIVKVVKEVTGVDFEVKYGPRREGDPPMLIADNSKILQKTSFKPKYDDIYTIVKTAWEWERKQ